MKSLRRAIRRTLPLALGLCLAAAANADQEQPTEEPPMNAESPAAAPASSSTAGQSKADSPWRAELTAYGWFSGLTSTIARNGSETTTEADLSDLLNVLDFAGFTHLEVQRGKWGMFTELDFVKVSSASEVRLKRTVVPFRIDTAGSLKQTMFELGAIRSFDRERVGFDLLAGARYYRYNIDAKAGPFGRQDVKDWVDPLVGGRVRFQLSEKWDASLRADVGGFGAGSELSFNGVAAFRYAVSERCSLGLGYRYLRVDYDARDTELTMETYGPIAGVSFRF